MKNTINKDLVITGIEKLRDGGTLVVMCKLFTDQGVQKAELRIDKNGKLIPGQELNITICERTRELFKQALLNFFKKLQNNIQYEYQKVSQVSEMLSRTPLEQTGYTDGTLVYIKCSDGKYRLELDNGVLVPVGTTEKELQEHGYKLIVIK